MLSGMVAWSVFRSDLRTMLPNWSTAETMRSIAVGGRARCHRTPGAATRHQARPELAP